MRTIRGKLIVALAHLFTILRIINDGDYQFTKARVLSWERLVGLMKEPKCYGKRLEAWDKCEACGFILGCSYETLRLEFPGIKVIGP